MEDIYSQLQEAFAESVYDAGESFQNAENTTNEGGVRYTIVNLDTGKSYVQASRQVIHGNSVSLWRSQISAFFRKALKNGPIEIEIIEGDILTISRHTAEKARSKTIIEDGIPRELTDNEFLVRLHAEAHIDELAEISHKNKRPPVPDDKNHSFAKDGFTYRTVYFQDFDNSYYKITISVGENNGISTVYNVGKIKADDIPDGNIISTIGSKADMSSTRYSIGNPDEIVKENDSAKIATAAVKHFGKTYRWSETGYLLADGSKLDFSGRHEGASGGHRTVDHRDILDIYPGDTELDGNGAMVDFMRQGNIRIMPEGDGINLQAQPTKAQERALDDFISRARGELSMARRMMF